MPLVGPPTAGLTSVEVDGCINLFNPNTQRAVILNETASRIWELSTGQLSVDEIVTTVATQYGRAPEEIADEVRGAIADFRAEGLLDDPIAS